MHVATAFSPPVTGAPNASVSQEKTVKKFMAGAALYYNLVDR